MGFTPELMWLILLVVLTAIEIATVGLFTIWFAAGALVAEVAAWLNAPFGLQVVLFFVASILMLIFTRPFAMKYINRNQTKTNVDSMIGKQAVVTKNIDNIRGKGQVVVQGMEWTARAVQDDLRLQVGDVVVIRAVSGVKLIVASVK